MGVPLGLHHTYLLQFLQAMSSPSGAVSTLIGLFSFAGPALSERLPNHAAGFGCCTRRSSDLGSASRRAITGCEFCVEA